MLTTTINPEFVAMLIATFGFCAFLTENDALVVGLPLTLFILYGQQGFLPSMAGLIIILPFLRLVRAFSHDPGDSGKEG